MSLDLSIGNEELTSCVSSSCQVTLQNSNFFLVVDDNNIFYLFDLSKLCGDDVYIYPELCFVVRGFEKGTKILKLGARGEMILFTGNFNTSFIKISDLEELYSRLKAKLRSNRNIPKYEIEASYTLVEDFNECGKETTINGYDLGSINSHLLLSFSENDNTMLFDLEKQKCIGKASSGLKIRPYTPAVFCGKLLEETNKIVTGTSEGYAHFLDIRNLQAIGMYFPTSNAYVDSSSLSDINPFSFNQKTYSSINCITKAINGVLYFGCNGFSLKFNNYLNLATKVYQSKGQVNDILINDDCMFIGSSSKIVLKYNSDDASLISKIPSSSSSIYNLTEVQLNNKSQSVFTCSGNSNYIDVFKEDVLYKFVI